MARPLKPIDAEQVFKLAKLGCTLEDIGEYFNCDKSTISRRFATDFSLGHADCKTSIRRWQIKKAHSGCTTMLIHLGKVYLNQTDRVDITSKGEQVAATVVQLPIKELHADSSTESGATDSSPGEHS